MFDWKKWFKQPEIRSPVQMLINDMRTWPMKYRIEVAKNEFFRIEGDHNKVEAGYYESAWTMKADRSRVRMALQEHEVDALHAAAIEVCVSKLGLAVVTDYDDNGNSGAKPVSGLNRRLGPYPAPDLSGLTPPNEFYYDVRSQTIKSMPGGKI